jgi:hypothetical protein
VCVFVCAEAVAAAGQDTIVYPTAAEAGGGGVAASRRKSDGDLLKQLRQLSQAPMPPAAVPLTAAAPAAAFPPAKAKAKARRGTKRRSSTGGRGGAAAAAEAAAAVSDGCASAGCARGMLVVVLDELDALLSGGWAKGGWCCKDGEGQDLWRQCVPFVPSACLTAAPLCQSPAACALVTLSFGFV